MEKTATASMWKQDKMANKQYQSDLAYYTQLLTGQMQQVQQQAQTQADYDISQAYENFRRNQRAVMNTAAMGEGAKERSQATLESQFAGAENQIRANMASTISSGYQKATEAYQKNIANAEKALDESSNWGGLIEDFIAEKAVERGYLTLDANKGETYYGKYYDTQVEGRERERTEGLTAMRFGFDPDVRSLLDVMAEEKPELFNYYVEHQNEIDSRLFDLDNLSEDNTYDWENRPSKREELEALKTTAEQEGMDISKYSGTAEKQVETLKEDMSTKQKADKLAETSLVAHDMGDAINASRRGSAKTFTLNDGTRLAYVNGDGYEASRMRGDLSKWDVNYQKFKNYGTDFSDELIAGAKNGTLKENDIVKSPTGQYWYVERIRNNMPYLRPLAKR